MEALTISNPASNIFVPTTTATTFTPTLLNANPSPNIHPTAADNTIAYSPYDSAWFGPCARAAQVSLAPNSNPNPISLSPSPAL